MKKILLVMIAIFLSATFANAKTDSPTAHQNGCYVTVEYCTPNNATHQSLDGWWMCIAEVDGIVEMVECNVQLGRYGF